MLYVVYFVEDLKITYSKSPHTNRCTVIPKGLQCTRNINMYRKCFVCYCFLFHIFLHSINICIAQCMYVHCAIVLSYIDWLRVFSTWFN